MSNIISSKITSKTDTELSNLIVLGISLFGTREQIRQKWQTEEAFKKDALDIARSKDIDFAPERLVELFEFIEIKGHGNHQTYQLNREAISRLRRIAETVGYFD